MAQRKSTVNSSHVLYFLLFSFLGTALLWVFKYHNQGLSIKNFQFSYPGNLVHFFLWLLSVIGVLVCVTLKNPGTESVIRFYKYLSIIGCLLLIAGKFLSYSNFPSSGYLLEQPMKKVVTGLLYLGYEGTVIITLGSSWTRIYGVQQLRFLKSGLNSVMVAMVLIAFSFIYTSPWYGNIQYDKASPYQYGVVLGAAVWSNNKPSPILVSRLDESMNLYRAGIIRNIILTGSNAPGEISEAEAAYNYLKKYDIPLNDIQMEKQTTSTTEQVKYIKNDVLSKKDAGKVLVISDKNHVRRVREIIKFYQVGVDVIGAELNLSNSKNLPYRLRESAALLIFWLFGL